MALSLLMCFDAPLQSWGTNSRFIVRDTATEPTKSGVVGLFGAALGCPRDDEARIAELASLRLGVRVEREGLVERDFHTIQNVPTTEGSGHRTMTTQRYYLAGALFLVGVEGDPALLVDLHEALDQPRWPLYFGRKAFVPARPFFAAPGNPVRSGAGLVEKPLEKALDEHLWLDPASIDTGPPLRVVIDTSPDHPEAELRHDHPVTFDRRNRRHTSRAVRTYPVELTPGLIRPGDPACS